jgi:SAM-dependent methyltransferase
VSEGFKDLFSKQSADYARFRPTYPAALFDFLAEAAPARGLALDCGTGSGQAALELATRFARVIATDPSEKQLASAAPHRRIEYRRAPAEDSGAPAASVDLLTAAQAFHWFKVDAFFAEARRILKPGGVLAFWSYALARISPAVDAVVMRLYRDVLGPYWEPERRLVESGYRETSLPFPELAAPPFEMTAEWSLERLAGYLGTWSALQAYRRARAGETDPLAALEPELRRAWGAPAARTARWEISLRACRKN